MGRAKKILELVPDSSKCSETKKPRITARLLGVTGLGLRLFGDTHSQAPKNNRALSPVTRDKI